MLQDPERIGPANTVPVENFTWQIKPPTTGVLVEVAQDIGQLQRSTERFGDRMGSIALVPENMDREMADGARDTRTIEVERRKIGDTNRLASIHLHSVDNGEEIAPAQMIAQHRLTQCPRDKVPRMSRVEAVDLLAPGGEGCKLVPNRAVAVCDVVDLTAERVDRIHPVSAMVWQETHCPVERRPRRLDPMPNRFEYRRITELAADGAERGVVHPRPNPVTTVATAATKSDVLSLTRAAKGSPRRSRRSRRTASPTITALSRRSPNEVICSGRPRALSTSAPVRSSVQSITRRNAGHDAGFSSASTPIPSAARSRIGR